MTHIDRFEDFAKLERMTGQKSQFRRKWVGWLVLASLFSIPASAAQLLQTTKTWEGNPIVYPKGTPEVTAVRIVIEEGKPLPYHCHPVPTLGYIVKGELEIETKSGDKNVVREGDAVVEVLNKMHSGIALKGPVEIVAFYVGQVGIPNTLHAGTADAAKYCSE
ncbi:Uncharacterised protein [BD1-7 clade bacterium]|uniref:Cupin 2 conserved barrel domain-containing protein n=1 Tax=BD1-7 clade bacterium TaxID=2029982 RepID=A0A5S9QZI9_9GAMM|nr:Uncharacterised protein [BD1-7 clade bacterium]